jgi:hypothetical protein
MPVVSHISSLAASIRSAMLLVCAVRHSMGNTCRTRQRTSEHVCVPQASTEPGDDNAVHDRHSYTLYLIQSSTMSLAREMRRPRTIKWDLSISEPNLEILGKGSESTSMHDRS